MSSSGGTPSSATRVLKSSPSPMKQGPMKATIPMASLFKPSSGFMTTAVSPTLSPTPSYKCRISPEHLGQRSPGSHITKVKSRTLGSASNSSGSAIRRTASLDTIYLKGQWPRDIYCMPSALQVNKATQTDESDWIESRKIHFITENDDKLEKIFRQRRQRSNNQQSPSSSRSQSSPATTPIIGDHTLTTSSQTNTSCILPRAMPMNIPIKPLPKPTMRSSVESLNQEIEILVLKASVTGSHNYDRCGEDYDKICQMTPEGHRAPLPDMFRNTRSVNTQTPSATDLAGSCHSSSPPSRDSLSPLIPGRSDTSPETDGSRGSSPDQEGNRLGTSPHLFMARGPPDGCERVHLKSSDERRSLPLGHSPSVLQPPCTFQLKPSQGSAFKMLQPNLHHDNNRQDLPLVPSEQDLT